MLETENLLTQRSLDHETRIAALEAKMSAISITAGGTIPSNVVTADASGNVDLSGILTTKGIVAGSYTVKNNDPAAKTAGEGTIASGDSEKKISTKAVSDTAKIFVTFESDPGARYWIEKASDLASFTVKLSVSAGSDVKFSWWIIEQK